MRRKGLSPEWTGPAADFARATFKKFKKRTGNLIRTPVSSSSSSSNSSSSSSNYKRDPNTIQSPSGNNDISNNRERALSSCMRHKRRRQSNNMNELEPLAAAQEIQDQSGRSHRNRASKRELYQKPKKIPCPFSTPLESSSTPVVHQNRKRPREKNTKVTVDLCGSDSDTSEEDNIWKMPHDTPTDQTHPPMSSLKNDSTPGCDSLHSLKNDSTPGEARSSDGTEKVRQHIKKKRKKKPAKVPPYPTTPLPCDSSPAKESTDDNENDSVIFQGCSPSRANNILEHREDRDANGPNPKTNKKDEDVLASEDRAVQENGRTLEERSTSKRTTEKANAEQQMSSAIFSGSTSDEITKRIPRKKQQTKHATAMTVPALKPIWKSKKPNERWTKIRKMDCTEGSYGSEEGHHDADAFGRSDIRDMCNAVENVGINEARRTNPSSIKKKKRSDRVSADAPTTSTNNRNDLPQASSMSLNLRKVNNRKPIGKTRGKKTAKMGTKIIPGAVFQATTNQELKDDQQGRWRSEQDQCEYPRSNVWSRQSPEGTVNVETNFGVAEEIPEGTRLQSYSLFLMFCLLIACIEVTALDWDPLNGRPSKQYGKTASLPSSSPKFSRVETQLSTRRSKRIKKQKTPETIDILSSDSEIEEDTAAAVEDEDEGSHVSKFPVKRLFYGKKVVRFEHKPSIKFYYEDFRMEISFFKSRVLSRGKENISIDMNSVDVMNFYPRESMDKSAEKFFEDLDGFIHLKCAAFAESMKTRKKRPLLNQKILVEFEDDQYLTDFIDAASANNSYSDLISEGEPKEVHTIAEPLIRDSEKQYNLRKQAKPKKMDSFIANRKSDDILVVYPFGADKDKLEAAASGLNELAWRESPESGKEDTVEVKSHYIEIRVEDYERLDTGQWLNDSLVDLWMQWISRDINSIQTSDIHFFTSHFYTTLASEGVEGVKSWTARKNINIFDKRLVFIPINMSLHWSLCVIVNPGAIIPSLDDEDGNDERDRPLSCMLFFDSLNIHRKSRVQKHAFKWLNYEWKRMKDSKHEPFNRSSCQIYDPQVPRQNNSNDCGVFVCRYALAIYQLRQLKFSYRDAGLHTTHKASSSRERKSRAFSDLITHGESFNFDVGDIQRIRSEFKTLLQRLQPLYKEAKDDRIKVEQEEKRARREQKRKEKEEAGTSSNTEELPCESSNDSSDSGKENKDGPNESKSNVGVQMEERTGDDNKSSNDSLNSGKENTGWADDSDDSKASVQAKMEELDGDENKSLSHSSDSGKTTGWADDDDARLGVMTEELDSKVSYGPMTQEQTIDKMNDKEMGKVFDFGNREEMAQPLNGIGETMSPLRVSTETEGDAKSKGMPEDESEVDSSPDDDIVVF